MDSQKKARRARKKKMSYLNDWEDDFNDIENNFKESNEFDKKLLTVKPEKTAIKKDEDKNLIEPAIEVSSIVDKGLSFDEVEAVSLKKTIELAFKEVIQTKEETLISQSDIQAVQLEYEKKIKELKDENEKLRSVVSTDPFKELASRKLKNNMYRFMQAVLSESKSQESEWPVISTNKLRKFYKVTSDSFKDCLTFGIDGDG